MCCGAYEGDWRETYLDGNRCNRSAVLDWKMEGMGPGTAGGDVDAEDDGGDGEVCAGKDDRGGIVEAPLIVAKTYRSGSLLRVS